MKQIIVKNINKSYKVHLKSEGVSGSIKSIFKRRFITTEAVKDISFEVNSSEVLGLIGLNGAGKTTIIKMISGVIKPDNGYIEVLGSNPFLKSNNYRKSVALVMGNKGQLDYDVSILDNVLLYASIYGISKKIALDRVNEMANELELSNHDLKKQVRSLSLWQRMKGELILSFLHLPKIIFLDEPTLGLDFISQRKIRNYIKSYKEKHDASIILTSHYIEDIEDLCERILIINKGQELYYGSIEKLKEEMPNYKKLKFITTPEIVEILRKRFRNVEFAYYNNNVEVRTEAKLIMQIIQLITTLDDYRDITIEEDNLDIIIEQLYKERGM